MNQNFRLQNQNEYPSFIKNALAINGSVTPIVAKKVWYIFIYACFISLINLIIPSFLIPIGPFEYAGLMMGLILVFRINSGYDRWWEARKIWGNLVNSSRNLAIITVNYILPNNKERALRITSYLSAMPYLIKNSLRNEQSMIDLNNILDINSIEQITKSQHRAVFLSSMIANELFAAKKNNELDSYSFLKAEEQRAALMDCLGACERILKTPIPFVMAVKSRRFILIFLLALPLALVNVSILVNPIITALVAYAIFSLDQIGVELQYPFSLNRLSHLPLDEICATIHKNISELAEMANQEKNHMKILSEGQAV